MKEFLDSVAFRLRARRALARSGWVSSGAAVLCGVLVAIAGFWHMPLLTVAAWAVLVACAVATAGLFLTVRFTRAEAAQVADLVLDTQSLFVTAIDPSHAATQQAHDACATRAGELARQTAPSRVVPLRFGARWLAALLPALAACAIVFAPRAAPPAAPAQPADVATAAATLDKQADRLEKRANAEDLARAERLRRLSRRLKSGDLNRRQPLEELGDLKRELRAEKLQKTTQAQRARRAAEAAGHSLGEGETTRQLGNELAKGARSRSQAERDAAAKKAQEQLRELAKLDREDREKAAAELERAAQRARAQGNNELAEALEAAAGAVRSGDPAAAEAAGNELAEAMRNLGSGTPGNEQLDQALAEAQAALDGQPMPGQGGDGQGSESDIAPGPRNWAEGPPGDPKEGGASGAGKGHSDTEQPGKLAEGGHQDANRFSDNRPDNWNEEYKELYEAALLNSDSRINTRVKGERSGDGKVQVVRGGQQAPRPEQARGAIAKLPVGYAEEARQAVDGETVPPGYRDAVRDYFNAEK